jgi:putative transcriptional regulator
MSSLQGQFLVASPHLGDGNFYRSVVLIIKHDDDGAFGLVLNRPTANTVGDVWRMVTEQELVCDRPIYLGGPVQGPLVCLHRVKSCAEAEVLPGVYFAAHKDELQKIVSQKSKPFRLFMGYAGWAGGQLEGEMKVGGWLTIAADKALVFDDRDDLWENVVQTIGQKIIAPAIKSKHVPPDPSLN